MLKSVDSMGNLVRGLASLGFVALIGAGGWFVYNKYYEHALELEEKDRQMAEMAEQHQAAIAEKNAEIERLDLSLKLLKVDHLMAELYVVDQWTNDDGQLMTKVEFVEVDDERHRLDRPRTFTIKGDEVSVYGWVAKFQDEYVEQGDPLRGKALYMFKNIHGSDGTEHGHALDRPGELPPVYNHGKQMTNLEQEIFGNFWEIANDTERAKKLGLRSIHGQAGTMKVVPDATYSIALRSTGDVDFDKLELPRSDRRR